MQFINDLCLLLLILSDIMNCKSETWKIVVLSFSHIISVADDADSTEKRRVAIYLSAAIARLINHCVAVLTGLDNTGSNILCATR